ncbi:MAG TPA: DNA repair protein RecO [Terriglobales bacterium]|nr:DNA repair protein RecO [Terriglobales bacterium]
MSLVKTEGIVLKSLKYGDSSLIFSFYTRDYGKVKVLAKGIKRTKSRILPPGTFSLVEIVFYKKERTELHLLSSAEILKSFPGLSKSLNRFSWASAVSELLDQLIKGEESNQRIFNLSLKTLSGMETADETNLEKLFWSFALKLSTHLGYKPKLDVCVSCGKEIKDEEVLFSPERGGVICKKCAKEDEYFLKLSKESYLAARKLLSLDINKVDKFPVDRESLDEVSGLVKSFISYHTGAKELKALDFLRKISV